MPALHIRDVPEETLAELRRRAASRGHSVQQELRDVLERAVAEPVAGGRPRRLGLRTVATGQVEPFDRDAFYGADER